MGWTGWSGLDSLQKQEIFLSQSVHTGCGAHPASYTSVALAPGVKWPEREADYSPPSSAKIKNGAMLNEFIAFVQFVEERNVAS
jgi:hypothetical protein